MKILILTQYFPPETGAPQNRLFEIAIHFHKSGDEVDILTAMPNYPKNKIFEGYRNKLFMQEEMSGLKVFRSFIYVGKSRSILARLLNYFSFVFSSLLRGIFLKGRYDYVICESPPLFLGISAFCISRLKKAKLIFNVSDLWPESAEKLGIITNRKLLGLAEKLELWLYKKSHIISGQTQGIVKNIALRSHAKNVYWLPNGVDPEIYNPDNFDRAWRLQQGFKADDFLVVYAGIIGYAQGLEVIIEAASKLNHQPKIKWLIIGDGPEKERLLKLKDDLNSNEVYFYANQEKKQMPIIVRSCNVTVVPLKRIPLFLGAIPSKIFENLAMGVPLLLGVEGEAQDLFIQQGKAGLAFEPGNAIDLASKTEFLFMHPEKVDEFAQNGKNYVREYFNRNKIATGFRHYLLQHINSETSK